MPRLGRIDLIGKFAERANERRIRELHELTLVLRRASIARRSSRN